MERSAGIGALLRRMEALLEPLEASGDPGRFFLATYLRTTRAVAEEFDRGGFRDPEWVERSRTDRLLQPLNRLATKRFLRESRAKVWANTRLLDAARRTGPDAYATRLAELERLAAARVADLMAPGQVVLKLAVKGFGVRLPDA
jgi:Family of unknown function (DUF5995)